MFKRSQRGSSLTESALVLSLVTVLAFPSLQVLSSSVEMKLNQVQFDSSLIDGGSEESTVRQNREAPTTIETTSGGSDDEEPAETSDVAV